MDGYCLAQDPTRPSIAYAGGSYYDGKTRKYRVSVSKTTDGGASWSERRLLGDGGNYDTACWNIAVAPGDSSIVYAGGQQDGYVKVFRSADDGNSWADISANLNFLYSPGDVVYTIWVHPDDPNALLVGTSRGVSKTTNGGANWQPTLWIPLIHDFVYHRANGTLYAASEAWGVFCSQDGGSSWAALNEGLGNLRALSLGLDPENGLLFVGTAGGAVWRLQVEKGGALRMDLSSSGTVDFGDFAVLAENWMGNCSAPDWCQGSDFDKSGTVDFMDLAFFTEYWLTDMRMAACWGLDEEAGDMAYDSEGDNHGTLHGNARWRPAGGKLSGALEFDGTDAYVITPFVFNPANRPFSVLAWVKGGEPGQVMISQASRKVGRITESGHTWLGTDPSDGRLLTSLMDMPFCSLESDAVITDGGWHHIGLVYDDDGRHRRLYVDGVEVAADAGVATQVPPDTGLHFGAGTGLAPGSFFSGRIDDIRLYNEALNAEEINEMVR